MEDGERAEYWSEAYKRMAARNIELGDIVASLTDELNDLRSGEYLARVIEERDRYRKALEEVQSAQFSNHGCMATILSDVSRIAAYALEATNEPT